MDNLSQYINSIGRYPLLTKTQEIMLSRQVREWLDAEEPTPQQVRIGKRAYEKLINCNLRIVVSIAKKYMPRARRTEMLDVIQEGNIGLAHGIKKFDPERGYALSTYIYWWIRQGITRHLSYHDRMIRLPCNGVDLLTKLRYWLPQFQQEHGRMPTQDEYADYLGVAKERVNDYLRHVNDCVSLDQKAKSLSDEGSALIEMIPDQREHPMQSLEWAIGVGALDLLLERLSEGDREILKMYYGMDGHRTHTLAEIGRTFGVSRERIRQRHSKALLKLRILSTGASVREVCK
jgi:RNA polymerase sigma factor (sigma-70 family)